MDNQKAREILDRHQLGLSTDSEKELIRAWLMFGNFPDPGVSEPEMSEDLDSVRAMMPFTASPVKKIRLWPRLLVAASIAVVATVGVIYFQRTDKVGRDAVAVASDIAPGVEGGSLTLSDGKVLALSSVAKGTTVEQPGVSISRSADGSLIYELKADNNNAVLKYNTLATANGEKVQVNLQDGTKVWLNAGSSLRYPTSFASASERRVELTGEGYFEVAKDRSKPFHVGSHGQDVAVLGTHFNINAYADEPVVRTTLLEGAVKLNGLVVLKPGELAINTAGKLKVQPANLEQEVAWKNGDFIFKGETLEGLMREIARWYDVKVVYADGAPMEVQLEGQVSMSRNLSEVLERMQQTGSVKFRVQDRTVTVSR